MNSRFGAHGVTLVAMVAGLSCKSPPNLEIVYTVAPKGVSSGSNIRLGPDGALTSHHEGTRGFARSNDWSTCTHGVDLDLANRLNTSLRETNAQPVGGRYQAEGHAAVREALEAAIKLRPGQCVRAPDDL